MDNKTIIYIVEDDESIRTLYLLAFEPYNYEIEAFESAELMLSRIEEKTCDLILMDVMLPGIDGISAIKLLKANKKFKHIPMIIVSAKGDEVSKVQGLDSGADDYLAKPFGILELNARVKANLRKLDSGEEKTEFVCGDIVIKDDEHVVTVKGNEVTLTLKEYNLLKILVENSDNVVSRDTLLEKVWGYTSCGVETRTLDMHVKSLRSKLAEFTSDPYIHTLRAVGYKCYKPEESLS